MKVTLIAVNKPLIKDIQTAEDLMSYCARVSSPQNQTNLNTAPKLLKYCLDNGHFSVFEMADMTVEIETSRAIAAQILRHRSFTFQEFSQRYAEVPDDAFEIYEARRQDQKNRQNSIDDMTEADKDWFKKAQDAVIEGSKYYYKEAIKRGIAKEQARFLLPLNTRTKLYMKGNVRSWIHYIELRCSNGTQLEHKAIADEIKKIFAQEFPVIAGAKGWEK